MRSVSSLIGCDAIWSVIARNVVTKQSSTKICGLLRFARNDGGEPKAPGLGSARTSIRRPAPMRPSGRAPDQMRELSFEPGFTRYAEGSCLVSFGGTRVLCTASVEDKVPPFLRGKGQGWVTAEYGMLPRATHTRGNREAAKGKQSGRTQEIQRLIGRSLRAVVDLPKLGERQVIV